ncbi:DNA-binding transcriptional LysR family regulator [Rhizobium aquaticum]|uniref:DNA-binding transcriptional LysR family regulator n=2 Tax=Rhizobium aquaticum TaxID=1549636 RepID=A0ABV2J6D1_9HYPH
MNGLFTFEAAARCGSFSAAGKELNVTPAAVSRMIARLEQHIDTTLFYRQAGGVLVTESGQLLFDAISRGFAGIEGALREIDDRRRGTETVTMSVSTSFTMHWMMPRMAEFKKRFPSVDLRYQLVMVALAGPVDDVDLGMRFMNGPDERLDASFIMPELMVPVCNPSYIREHGLDQEGRNRMPDTTINLSDAQPNWSGVFAPAQGQENATSMIFSDYSIVVQAALLGQGVALGWLNTVSHWLRTGALVPASEQIMRTGRMCQLVRSRAKPVRPIVTAITEWIIAEFDSDLRAVDNLYPNIGLSPDAWSSNA